MTGRATNAMLLQGAAPRERGQSTGAFAVRLVAGPRRSTAVHGTALCGALIALALEGSILLFCWYFSACRRRLRRKGDCGTACSPTMV